MNEKQIAHKINNENELSENLSKDFISSNYLNKKNLEELNDYGKKILSLTTQEVLKLKNEI